MAWPTLFRESALPLIADESCVREADVEVVRRPFPWHQYQTDEMQRHHTRPADDRKARSLGMRVMVGSMNESSIGSAAIAHLLPYLDYVDMDGPLLLKEDLATGLGLPLWQRDHSRKAPVWVSDTPGFFQVEISYLNNLAVDLTLMSLFPLSNNNSQPYFPAPRP